MANGRKKNCWYVDTIGTISTDALTPILCAILVTPNAPDSRVTIKESVSGTIVVDVKIETMESRYIDFMDFMGINLTQNFEIATLTNIDTVILYGVWGAPVGATRT